MSNEQSKRLVINDNGDEICTECGLETDVWGCGAEDCATRTVDVESVEHYDQLDAEARAEYRAQSVLTPATEAELDRIDAGLKARCLG